MIKNKKIKHSLVFLSATLLYALCQMLFGNILIGDDLWNNFFIQLSSLYIVILILCIVEYMLLLFLNKYLPYSKNVLFRILADFVGVSLICLILLSVFNYLTYDVLLISKDGMPSFLVKFAFVMTNAIPILLAFELIWLFQSEQKAIADSEKAKREALLFEHETLRAQINPHFLFNSLNVLSSLIYESEQCEQIYQSLVKDLSLCAFPESATYGFC